MESFPISLPSFPEMWKTRQHRPRPGGANPTTPSSGTPSRLPLSGTLISGPPSQDHIPAWKHHQLRAPWVSCSRRGWLFHISAEYPTHLQLEALTALFVVVRYGEPSSICVTYVCAGMSEGVWRRKMCTHRGASMAMCWPWCPEFGSSPGTDCSDVR